MLVATHGGLREMLRRVLSSGSQLKLFKNDIQPKKTDTAEDYEEADFIGYSGLPLSGGWDYGQTTVSHPAQEFTSTVGGQEQPVYGYLITSGPVLLWSERFTDGPYTIRNNGDVVKVTPTISFE